MNSVFIFEYDLKLSKYLENNDVRTTVYLVTTSYYMIIFNQILRICGDTIWQYFAILCLKTKSPFISTVSHQSNFTPTTFLWYTQDRPVN